ncbi:MAG: hypothetical protein ACFFCZ_18360 [Promethearchaeota archaeon]
MQHFRGASPKIKLTYILMLLAIVQVYLIGLILTIYFVSQLYHQFTKSYSIAVLYFVSITLILFLLAFPITAILPFFLDKKLSNYLGSKYIPWGYITYRLNIRILDKLVSSNSLDINSRQHKVIRNIYIIPSMSLDPQLYADYLGCSLEDAKTDLDELVEKDILIAPHYGTSTYRRSSRFFNEKGMTTRRKLHSGIIILIGLGYLLLYLFGFFFIH